MTETSKFPFNLTVYNHRRPHLRNETLEMVGHIGLGAIETMFDKMKPDENVHSLKLLFPERFLNIVEQRVLLQRIEKYLTKVEDVIIHTHSPFICQTVPKEHSLVIKDYSTAIDENEEGKMYVEPMYLNGVLNDDNGPVKQNT